MWEKLIQKNTIKILVKELTDVQNHDLAVENKYNFNTIVEDG